MFASIFFAHLSSQFRMSREMAVECKKKKAKIFAEKRTKGWLWREKGPHSSKLLRQYRLGWRMLCRLQREGVYTLWNSVRRQHLQYWDFSFSVETVERCAIVWHQCQRSRAPLICCKFSSNRFHKLSIYRYSRCGLCLPCHFCWVSPVLFVFTFYIVAF